MNILVGDIGGTHCRLALAHRQGAQVRLTHVQRYTNSAHAGLDHILRTYLATQGMAGPASEPLPACLAVAGPTDGRQVAFTNLDWHIDTQALEGLAGLGPVTLVNDFVAVGWGLNALQPEHLHTLQAGAPQAQGVKIAVGAGTGLGVSLAIHPGPDQAYHRPIPTEGGHISFAPLTEEQDRLLAFMRTRYGRVSAERLVSGPGILDIFQFCSQEAGEDMAAAARHTPAQISQAALAGDAPTAIRALALFARIYGQVAGDIALLANARGGVYLAGGIPAQILPVLDGPEFLAGFGAKGRFSPWMHGLAVSVVLDGDIGLRGAALAASP